MPVFGCGCCDNCHCDDFTYFTTLIFSDAFTDTDTTELESHTPNLPNGDSTWDVLGTSAEWTIVSNQLERDISASTADLAVIGIGVADCRVTAVNVRIDFTSGTHTAGIIFRYSDSNNYWKYEIYSGGGSRLIKVVSGSPTTVDSDTFTFTSGATADMQVCMCGNSILAGSGFGGSNLSASDSFNATETIAGVYTSPGASGLTNELRFDGFIARV